MAVLLLLAACILALSAGPDGWDGAVFLLPEYLAGTDTEGPSWLLWEIRLPRVMMAAGIGAVLSISGLVFQTILGNPLAEPYILGISGGAAAGVVLGILWGVSLFWGDIFAFAGGMISLLALFLLGGRRGASSLLLAGVMINAFCGAVVLFLVSLLQHHNMGTVLCWYLGDLGAAGREQAFCWSGIFLSGCLGLCLCGHKLNLLLLGENTAKTLGLRVEIFIPAVLAAVSALVCAAVAAAGPLGFVGLVVPQIMRKVLGHDHRVLLPACMLGGAFFLVACDMFSRTLPSQGELPIGVITAMIGAPVFIALLRRSA